jgi:hypothetical protein
MSGVWNYFTSKRLRFFPIGLSLSLSLSLHYLLTFQQLFDSSSSLHNNLWLLELNNKRLPFHWKDFSYTAHQKWFLHLLYLIIYHTLVNHYSTWATVNETKTQVSGIAVYCQCCGAWFVVIYDIDNMERWARVTQRIGGTNLCPVDVLL